MLCDGLQVVLWWREWLVVGRCRIYLGGWSVWWNWFLCLCCWRVCCNLVSHDNACITVCALDEVIDNRIPKMIIFFSFISNFFFR